MHAEWNASVDNLDECIKTKIEEAPLEMGNLIAAWNLGFDVQGKPLARVGHSRIFLNHVRKNVGHLFIYLWENLYNY